MVFRNIEGPAAILADIAMAGMGDIRVAVIMAGIGVIAAAITATITTMMFFGE
jgi:hypothetical protein